MWEMPSPIHGQSLGKGVKKKKIKVTDSISEFGYSVTTLWNS
jgi:hypothetical protein